ncbi:hypothetical protein NOVOSPHI9U_260035 [Novosphingobium sp. 9U]|nr:hypothetical protein NOVOSPHI9U_260035 [Novosphingobium sp. 9U]
MIIMRRSSTSEEGVHFKRLKMLKKGLPPSSFCRLDGAGCDRLAVRGHHQECQMQRSTP